jgi:ABC-2 type transport system ATP-binding protein
MLGTFFSPTGGSAQVAGFDTVIHAPSVRRHLGYLAETLPGAGEARVREYLDFRARVKDIPRRTRRAEIERCLQCCQLEGVARRLLGRLSQGFRRRVGLADALLGSPAVLLLDEPTIGLDPLQVRQTRQLLAEVATRSTVLMSTHLLSEAEAVCHRVLILIRGELAADIDLKETGGRVRFELEVRGPAEEIVRRLGALPAIGRVELLGSEGDWHTFSMIGEGETDLREPAAALCHQLGWGVRELHRVRSLEEQFVRLTALPRREVA